MYFIDRSYNNKQARIILFQIYCTKTELSEKALMLGKMDGWKEKRMIRNKVDGPWNHPKWKTINTPLGYLKYGPMWLYSKSKCIYPSQEIIKYYKNSKINKSSLTNCSLDTFKAFDFVEIQLKKPMLIKLKFAAGFL